MNLREELEVLIARADFIGQMVGQGSPKGFDPEFKGDLLLFSGKIQHACNVVNLLRPYLALDDFSLPEDVLDDIKVLVDGYTRLEEI